MSIEQNLQNIKSTLPKHVTLVAVSKTKPLSDLMEAYNAGQRVFGENKIQEMTEKHEDMPKDVEWHMIGHVQRNKVKYMASFVHLIHGVDNIKLLDEINKQAMKHNRVIDCLIQIKIATEDTKFGMSVSDAKSLLSSKPYAECSNVNIVGVMGMATFTDDKDKVKEEFITLKNAFNTFKENHPTFKIISMGMSGDYQLAIDCGSTMIRVGSSIFGLRN
ncbi:YggS family pyridoxal phosphate-dependent enzyme [Tamlana sp. 2201CG12-4]|uniref:YggS family pyridoxal phosphate-dependent enzyme n=1 Tax=Tamlana sp. 2201CG12-4 TaxID=3112582 RepID=UPI002DBC1456|nr:YggS family pyridoxal phosphate-dependent enzyme [Tamlana sp. 2201CG12-4]MEC3907731.1 YggS family pyridoxal phosphate-dependent enzyme [Tamlana sp. 2201CG12-4]